MPVSEQQFWEAVELLDYPNNYHKYQGCWEKTQVKLLRKYSENDINQFYDILKKFSCDLYDRCIPHDIAGCDSGYDASNLAVSFGKDRYHKLLESQEEFDKFIERYEYDNYCESFSYCFLIMDD